MVFMFLKFWLVTSIFVFGGSIFARNAESTRDLRKNFVRPKSIPYLEDNQYTKERDLLGKMLFFDPRLSGSNSISCATCHNPSFAWSDGLPRAIGHGHKELARKSPTISNLAWTEKMMWDGRFSHLEGQALGPIGSEAEMNMNLDGLADKIKKIAGYRDLFQKAYSNQEITPELVAKAIGVFERGVVSGNAPFDLWVAGDESAISEDAKKGFVLFNTKANCVACHSGWRFTDDSFHDIGLAGTDIGRGKFLKLASQQFAFKTPGLRNVSLRGSFMHDGSKQDLAQVIEFYIKGGSEKRESLSDSMKPLELTQVEKRQLLDFLKTLTSKDKKVEFPILPR